VKLALLLEHGQGGCRPEAEGLVGLMALHERMAGVVLDAAGAQRAPRVLGHAQVAVAACPVAAAEKTQSLEAGPS
jgi:hypothetical protein